MPIYDYACASCGPFSALRPLGEFNDPGICPQCGSVSPKSLSLPAYHGASTRQSAYDAIASLPLRDVRPNANVLATRHGMKCSCCMPLSAVSRNS